MLLQMMKIIVWSLATQNPESLKADKDYVHLWALHWVALDLRLMTTVGRGIFQDVLYLTEWLFIADSLKADMGIR